MSTQTAPGQEGTARRAQRLAYTSWIEQTCRNDPGARTALRNGLRRDLDSAHVRPMHRLITPWLPTQRTASDAEQRAYYTVAAMIASQPRSGYPRNEDPGTGNAPDTAPEPAAHDTDQPRDNAPAAHTSRYGASLGTAFALAVIGGPGRDRDMRQSTAESRLNLLTRQSANGLHRHLPASVRYLRDLDVPIDWAQLLDDLIAWPVHSGRISRRWLQDYYRRLNENTRAKTDEADQQQQATQDPHTDI
ncbi:type I-E CRISPR-associated protein Cse2/CasB [Streptomyces sp. NPDC002935]|uniref:type I-E CRISPR-associated protein Cse2/CasB n=1 Tax=Streptomyces sp. NPDC002935 TaxID=3154545 RepID=UPI00339DC585